MTAMIFLPALGAFVQAWSPRPVLSRWVALTASLLSSVFGYLIVAGLHLKWVENPMKIVVPWMSSYSMNYAVALDGLNSLPVLLVCTVFPLLIVSEWHRTNARRGLHGMVLLLQTAILGALCSQDLFLMFFFWVLITLPSYFLVVIWGGDKREPAAFKQIVVASVANAFVFLGVLLIYYALDPHTFLIEEILPAKLADKTFVLFNGDLPVQPVALALIAFGLALRAPIWPFQGWFKQVSLEVPSTIFVALHLAGVPVAITLFARLGYTLFPDLIAEMSQGLIALGMANLAIAVFSILAEKDIRGILAYLAQAFAGMAILGLGAYSSVGMVGSAFQLLGLGLGIAGLGFVAEFLHHRRKSYDVDSYGALIKKFPLLGVIAAIYIASILGIPGLVGFVGSSLLFIGQFSIHPFLVVGASFVLILLTGFLFQTYRKLFLGVDQPGEVMAPVTFREAAYFFPLVLLMVLAGVMPEPLLEIVRPTVNLLLQAGK